MVAVAMVVAMEAAMVGGGPRAVKPAMPRVGRVRQACAAWPGGCGLGRLGTGAIDVPFRVRPTAVRGGRVVSRQVSEHGRGLRERVRERAGTQSSDHPVASLTRPLGLPHLTLPAECTASSQETQCALASAPRPEV